jgi:hypothetical protein
LAVGASLVLVIVTVKSSNAEASEPSVALTRTVITPTSPLSGVPENSPVAALNVSQLGRAAPSGSVAVSASVSPRSTSAKVSAGRMNENGASSVAFWSAIAFATVGVSLTGATLICTVTTSE